MPNYKTPNDILLVLKRDGSSKNPYVDIQETLQVANNKVMLNEVPDSLNKIIVKNDTGIELFETDNQFPDINEFYVDYRTGFVYFHQTNEGKKFTFQYSGTGKIAIHYSRIYFENNDEQETIKTIRDISNEAQTNAEYALNQGDYAKQQAENITSNEDVRLQNEEERQNNEQSRKDNEILRDEAEEIRKKNEQQRTHDEESRSIAESIRVHNEDERIASEEKRVNAEQLRVTQETERQNLENVRKQNEENRQSNENARVKEHSQRIKIIDNTKFINPYSSTSTYNKNNIVFYNGSSFISKIDNNIGNIPPDPLYAYENEYWALLAKKGSDGVGSVSIKKHVFIATEGQTKFVLPFLYEIGTNKVRVTVNGSLIEDYVETNSTTITLVNSVPAGTKVIVEVFSTEFDDRIEEFNNKMDELDSAILNVNNQSEYAKTQGDYSKTQGDYAKTQGEYAKEQGDYAKTQGLSANQAASAANDAAQNATAEASNLSQLKTDVSAATDEANSAATSATQAATNANTAAQNATTQANYAKQQGDYAKQQGDIAKGIIESGTVASVNGQKGAVVLNAEDVNAIPATEKGVAGGVAKLNEDGKVVDASGNEVEGKVKSVNGQTGEVNISIPTKTSELVNDSDFATAKYVEDEVGEVSNELASHLADYVKHPAYAVTTGSANAYEVTLTPAPTAYEDGFGIVVAIHADSTGESTLNVNGLGAIPIKKSNGNDVTNLKINGIYTLRYRAGNFILQGEGSDFSDTDKSNLILINSINTIYDM